MSCRSVVLFLATILITSTASAQTPAPPTDTRPATTTFLGDTGLWYVPTAEILPARKWSLSAYRVNFDDNQGFSDVSNWPVTFAFGGRPLPAMPSPPPAAPQNRPPSVRARCQPCTVEVGKSSTLSVTAQDPDGDALTYTWSAADGALTSASAAQTIWMAPMVEGPVPVAVTVTDGRGASASDVVTIQVVRTADKSIALDDIHFDFDRYSLRPEATRMLGEVVQLLQKEPALRFEMEGHTCNIGTPEYNLALGERRATAVRDYFVSRGIAADRLSTVSYGEERPKYENAREETRRLNRRAVLVVRVQQ